MQAMVLNRYNHDLVLAEVALPGPGPLDVILKVSNCGICGTDLKIISGKLAHIIKLPHIPGHEISGEIVEVGSRVKNVKVGQQGIVYFYLACGNCELCKNGRENICYSVKRLGFELDGGYGQFVKFPAHNFCAVNRKLSFSEMAVLPDAVAAPYHALKTLASLKAGQTLLIVGLGGLGIHAVQIANLFDCRIAVADIKGEAVQLAGTFGADLLINSNKEDPFERVMDWTHGKGVDIVLEGVGVKQTFSWSLKSLKRGGRLVLMGYDPVDMLPLRAIDMHYNEWSIVGSRLATRRELIEVIDYFEQGKIQPVIAKTIPLHKANSALAEIKEGKNSGRIVLDVD